MSRPLTATQPAPRHSARLTYEVIQASHQGELLAVLGDPRLYEHVNDGQAPTPDALRAEIEGWVAGPQPRHAGQVWRDVMLRSRATGQPLGRVGATWHGGQVELAYFVAVAAWGQGYGAEAVAWMEAACVAELPVEAFWIAVSPGNLRSAALALKMGYLRQPEGSWPRLYSHEPGDWVFRKPVSPSVVQAAGLLASRSG